MTTNLTILLAEDNDDDVVLLKKAFERVHLGNPLQVVRNGADAIAYLEGAGRYADRAKYPLPFLLLLDLRMPEKSGLEVLEWIRQRPEFNDLEVVILTSSNDSVDLARAFRAGAASYLVKSPDFEDLFELVGRLGCYVVLTHEKPELPTLQETLAAM